MLCIIGSDFCLLIFDPKLALSPSPRATSLPQTRGTKEYCLSRSIEPNIRGGSGGQADIIAI